MLTSVFYHVWLPGRSNLELILVKEQIHRLLTSGLAEKATVEVVFSGRLSDKALSYSCDLASYGFNVHIAQESSTTLFEGYTLARIFDFALTAPSARLLYFHTKGISHVSNPVVKPEKINAVQSWRKYLEWGCIDLWETQVEKLENHDVAGVNYTFWPWPHFSGNFWWARADYISRLPHPTDSEYQKDFRDIGDEKRLKHEKWIGLGHPKVYSHINAPAPYDNPFPISPTKPKNTGEPTWFWLYRDDIAPFIEQKLMHTELMAVKKISVSVLLLGNDCVEFNKSIQALLKQTCDEWECILVIPDSIDRNLINAETIDRFTIRETRNGFSATVLNDIIKNITKGDLVMLLNAGNILSADYIAECLIELRMQPETAFCFGFENVDLEARANGKLLLNYMQIFASNDICTPFVFRRSDWENNLGFDEQLKFTMFLWDFCLRLCINGRLAVQNPYCVAGKTGWNSNTIDDAYILFKKYSVLTNNLTPTQLFKVYKDLEKSNSEILLKLKRPEQYFSIRYLLNAIFKKVFKRIGL